MGKVQHLIFPSNLAVSDIFNIKKPSVQEQITQDRTRHFEPQLVQVFLIPRDFSEATNLSRNEKRLIQEKYVELKNLDVGQSYIILEQLKDSGDLATIEKVFKFLTEVEVHYHQYDDPKRVHNCIVNSIPEGKPELKSWVMQNFKQGIGYKINKFLWVNFPKPSRAFAHFKSHQLPWIMSFMAVVAVCLNNWKDVVIFVAYRHYYTIILVCFYS